MPVTNRTEPPIPREDACWFSSSFNGPLPMMTSSASLISRRTVANASRRYLKPFYSINLPFDRTTGDSPKPNFSRKGDGSSPGLNLEVSTPLYTTEHRPRIASGIVSTIVAWLTQLMRSHIEKIRLPMISSNIPPRNPHYQKCPGAWRCGR